MLQQVTKEEWAKLQNNTCTSVVKTYNNSYVTLLVNKSNSNVIGVMLHNSYFVVGKHNLSRSYVVNNLLFVKSNNNLFMLDH